MISKLTFNIIFLGLIFFYKNIFACSCWHPDPDEYIKAGSMIFFGKVTAVKNLETHTKTDQGIVVASYYQDQATFKVIRSYKGEEQDYMTVSYSRSNGVGCGWSFKEGQEIMVFASGDQQKGYQTGMCSMIPYTSAKRLCSYRVLLAYPKRG